MDPKVRRYEAIPGAPIGHANGTVGDARTMSCTVGRANSPVSTRFVTELP